jgi:hypothetical protein
MRHQLLPLARGSPEEGIYVDIHLRRFSINIEDFIY